MRCECVYAILYLSILCIFSLFMLAKAFVLMKPRRLAFQCYTQSYHITPTLTHHPQPFTPQPQFISYNSIHSRLSRNLLSSQRLWLSTSTPLSNEAKPQERVNYFAVVSDANIQHGEYATIISSNNQTSLRVFTDVKTLNRSLINSTLSKDNSNGNEGVVWIRGRVDSIRAKGNACFIVIRSESFNTVQCVHFKNKKQTDASKQLLGFVDKEVTAESIVDIFGVIVPADVKSCTQNDVEIQIVKIFIVSKAPSLLPFSIEDASRSQTDIDASSTTDKPFASVPQDIRLNNRWLDLRVPANNAIMRVKSGILRLFRDSLYNEGFTEINTPKLISGQSEGGSEVFRLDYFGQSACLAQSPQLYKQMAISADLERVFEVGPVFRAENSNTRRHLCEFTGLDIEMAIKEHYNEVLQGSDDFINNVPNIYPCSVCHRMFKHIFTGLEVHYAKELSIIRQQYPCEPIAFTDEVVILHWPEAMALLKQNGIEVDEMEDLSSATELKLGEIVKNTYHTDFFILDQYPSKIRPFYTMPNADNSLFSNSYDMFIRGQEICSGSQRCHDVAMLEKRIVDKGMDLESLKYYVDSFRHAVPPHAGAGIGLERVVFLYLGLDNVRKASMFPRDPNRCVP